MRIEAPSQKGIRSEMNRLNWTYKEQYIDYHVLKWPTSHLHPRIRTSMDASPELKGKMPGMPEAPDAQTKQPEGIGTGVVDSSGSGRWTTGGVGQDGMAQETARDATHDKDGVSLSPHGAGRQTSGQEDVSESVQTAAAEEMQNMAAYSTAYRAGQAVRKLGGRIQDTIGRLRDVYERQQRKTAALAGSKGSHMQPEKEKRGTRQVSKDEVLAMQAENNYLLDSYDRNGQYSMLGK